MGTADVLQISNKRDHWWIEIIFYIVLIGFCYFYLVGFVIYAAFKYADQGSILAGTFLALVGIAGGNRLVRSAIERYAYYQDKEPKLSLSEHALCDHRTGECVELASVDSIRLDSRSYKGNEYRANLYLTTKDEVEHLFDLLQLKLSSDEIARKVTQNAGIKDAEGVRDPNEPLTPLAIALMGLFAVGALWQVYNLVTGLTGVGQ